MSITAFNAAQTPNDISMKLAIADAANALLERGVSFDALTVSAVCRQAHISRQTFYVHFKDKTDLVVWLDSNLVMAQLVLVGVSKTWEEAFDSIIRDVLVNANRLAWGAVFSSRLRVLCEGCAREIEHSLVRELERERGVIIAPELRFHCKTFPSVLLGIIGSVFYRAAENEQCANDADGGSQICSEERHKIARYMCAYVPRPLYDAMLAPRVS